ncbi:sensor histidine kinase [Mycolicibacterium sp.]|uniref:sensor histidine kinase n=1 Tax=Mycolicibacterium sp. TaxID=2320850 RepID=UPI0037C9956D
MRRFPASDSDRIRCALAVFIGFGYLFYLWVSIPELTRDATIVAPWWTPTAVTLAFAPGLLLLGCGFLAPVRAVRVVAAICAISYVACLGLWLVAWKGTHVDSDRATWLFYFPGLATLAACLVWRWPWVCLHLVTASVLATVVNSLGRSPAYSLRYLPIDLLAGLSFIGLFVGAALAAIATAKKLELTRAGAYTAAAHESEVSARATERARYNRIVHDQVLSTLLTASEGISTPRLTGAASSALEALTKQPRRDDSSANVSGPMMVNGLRLALEAIDDGVLIGSRSGPGTEAARYPSAVLRAFEGAASEALRNSVKHAGPAADREIAIEIDCDMFDVVIADTGVGFNPDQIPPGRLGVRGSIHERMLAVEGASASIKSIPSVVTVVRLHWDRP